ncbi:MAG: long-chain-fatty-acid--CoA ligase [Blastomonas sp.]
MTDADSRKCLGSSLRYWAETRPDAVCLDDGKQHLSFAEVDRLATRYARALVATGAGMGARIAWLGKNSNLYFVLMAAASRAGMVITPVGWRLAVPEVRYILEDTRAPILLAESGFADSARAAADGLHFVQHLVIVDSDDGFDGWVAAQGEAELPAEDTARPVLQLYTSGTTGNPKGAVLNNDNLFNIRRKMASEGPEWAKFAPEHSLLVIMPVGHIAGSGCGAIAFYNGCRGVVRAEFTPDAVLDTVDDGVTHMFLVPTALQMVITHERAARTDWSRLQLIMYGAAPMPLELLRQAMRVTGETGFCQQYGMTETTGTFCSLPPEDHDPAGNVRMRSAGKPLPGVEAKIVDDAGRELPRGAVGEIVTRSPLNMVEYWQNAEKTAETVDSEGWLRTGDAAYMDEDGYIYIQDRVKDMIISGGENVYPAEVENAIFGHPDVLEVAVIGVPDPKWGEAVKAVVSQKPGHVVDPASVIAWARERIAPFKVPKSVDIIPVMPRNASGKILRRELRDPYWAGRDRAVN